MAKVEIKSDEIGPALDRLATQLSDLTPYYNIAGEIILDSTVQRFKQGVAPDGTPWAPKSESTIRRYKSMVPAHHDVRPLFGPNGKLHSSINYSASAEGLEWGPGIQTRDYAATMQFGAAKGAFGRTKFNGPIPWGDIPARPYLGLSAEDETNLIEELRDWLSGATTSA